MCGLVGIVQSSTAPSINGKDAAKMLPWLLKLDTYRGPHSTGIAGIWHDKEGKAQGSVLKRPIPGEYFIDTGEFAHFQKGFDSATILLGHNRYATMGSKDQKSAHPHFTKDIIMTHNGTLRHFESLEKHLDPDLNKLDSARICMELQVNGSNIKTIESLIGAYAIVWFDQRTNKLYMARNDERTLYIGVAERQTLVWASVPWLIHGAAATTKTNLSAPVMTIESEYLYEFDLATLKFRYGAECEDSKKDFEMVGVTKTKFKNNKSLPTYHNNHYSSYGSSAMGNDYPVGGNSSPKQSGNGGGKSAGTNIVPITTAAKEANKVLKGTGISVGSQLEVTVNYQEYSNKKKINGWASSVTTGKPVYQVVITDVDATDFDDDEVFSYHVKVTGAVRYKKDEIVVYAQLVGAAQRLMGPDDYAKAVHGDEALSDVVASVIGDKGIPVGDNDDMVKGPKGVFIPIKVFDEFAAGGCVGCGVHVGHEQANACEWIGQTNHLIVCPACLEQLDGDNKLMLEYNGFSGVVQ